MTEVALKDIPPEKAHFFDVDKSLKAKIRLKLSVSFLLFIGRPIFFVFQNLKIYGKHHLKNLEPGIITCNHCHPLECAFIGNALWPRLSRFVVQSDNVLRKDLGWLTRMSGAFGVKDKYPMSIMGPTKKALSMKQFVTIFPEGVLKVRNQKVLPFHKGAFYIAIENQVPLIPMVEVLIPRKKLPLLPSFTNKVKLFILEPIDTKNYGPAHFSTRQKANLLAEEVRQMMQDKIDQEKGL